ncbi:MAG: thermonuclease family protein [Planctomycetota bacterium]
MFSCDPICRRLCLAVWIGCGLLLWGVQVTRAEPEAPRRWQLPGESMQAVYDGMQGEHVMLRPVDGHPLIYVSLDQLSVADFWYVLQTERTRHFVLPPGRQEAEVVRVADGDSFTVRLNGKVREVRLYGIDAPDHGQPFVAESRERLCRLIDRQTIQLETIATDKYGRLVCRVWVRGQSVNNEMVRGGWAWHYRAFNDDVGLAELEQKARQARVGLWVDPDPAPPWEWRKRSTPSPR